MKTSESINELADALSKAQAKIEGAKKDALNPHFKSKYADLASVWEAIREPLAANGLSIAQGTEFFGDADNLHLVLCTRLLHKSGQWIESVIPVRPVKDDPQGMGSALTYARRYALSAMAGVAPEDDDGEAAMGNRQFNQPARSGPTPLRPPG